MNPIRKLYADLKIACVGFYATFKESRLNTYKKGGQYVNIYVLVVPTKKSHKTKRKSK
jgi:hypothetical protein